MAKDWVGGNAAVFKTLGASNHTDAERQREDYYATEPKATEWLCKLERFEGRILEPSCGEGHMSEVMKAAGYEVVSSDIIDRGYGEVADFLSIDNLEWDGNIVTNPPYKYAQEFVENTIRQIAYHAIHATIRNTFHPFEAVFIIYLIQFNHALLFCKIIS